MKKFAIRISFLFFFQVLLFACNVDTTPQVITVTQTIVWKGSFASADEIENPEYLWAYYNTTDGCSYIYDGEKWTLLAASGKDGIDGHDGIDGKDGIDGEDGTDGTNGTDGTDGVNARVVILYVLNGGILPDDAPYIYTYGRKTPLQLVAPQQAPFAFEGFYYNADFSGQKVTELDDSYAYGQVLFAKWSYKITFHYNDERESITETIYNIESDYYLPVPVRTGYIFGGWYTDENYAEETQKSTVSPSYGDMELYALWIKKDIELNILPPGTDGTAGADWTYVEFGRWPQTRKKDNITVDESKTRENEGFISYLGSDGEWYVKVSENPYRDNYIYSDGTPVSTGKITYFKVEPIKWRVLTNEYIDYMEGVAGENEGEIIHPKYSLLLAENILTAMPYNKSTRRIYNRKEIYPNDYEYSLIRAWLDGIEYINSRGIYENTYLNKGFFNMAFNLDKSCLMRCGLKKYITSEYMFISNAFLLSPSEVTNENYGFTPFDVPCDARERIPTDYAIANKAAKGSAWWLRCEEYVDILTDEEKKQAPIIWGSGKTYKTTDVIAGVVPAVVVDLTNQ
ncbi:Listeria/Bacterioides repeat-containing protein [Treponema bryantii]|uniref:Listeria/Bacterioides repeat-containing protein n=1 Tax=Treponema bryantii TaxID=163 RepID=A0A1H9IDT4_9SPIR|nr:InlB B-repeat-containing protein [Treponema bryantii]SEQ72739.1 Listeria/Bacterioides repeat-containing protein [Treponema bryantii]